MSSKIENIVETILCEVDAKAAASRLDSVLSTIRELRKVTGKDPKFDKDVRSLEDHAKRIAMKLNKML